MQKKTLTKNNGIGRNGKLLDIKIENAENSKATDRHIEIKEKGKE